MLWRFCAYGFLKNQCYIEPFLLLALSGRGMSFLAIGTLLAIRDLATAVLSFLGFAASPRGSSSRGATGLLRNLIRQARAGEPVGFLPDGPRGPAGTAKPGVIGLARAAGAPLVPVGVSASPCKRFGSWDRALLPLPFARVACRYGKPIHVPKKTAGQAFEKLRSEFEAALDRMNRELDAELGIGVGSVAASERR